MSDFLETLLEQTAGLRAPIDGDAPAGADLALEAEFEKIKNELEKLTNLAGGDVDWRVVVDGSEELLRARTKDLRLAVWLAAGALERTGWAGLARGLTVLRAYVTDLWEHAFPKRDKARANIVVWLGERAGPVVQNLDVRLEDGDVVRACASLAEEIDRAVADKLGDAFAGMRGLVQTTRARVRDIPEPPPPPPPPPPPEAEKPPEAPSQFLDDDEDYTPPPSSAREPARAAAPGAVAWSARPEDAEATARACGEALVALAQAMVAQDPTRAWAYRLHRIGAWLPFERAHVDDGVVATGAAGAAESPPAALLATLGELFTASRWHELVVAAEEASARYPLWLDAQRLTVLALERMGTAYAPARETAGREAADFARRNANLLEARFADGTALASPEALEWLEEEARRWKMPGARATDVARTEDTEHQRRLAEARALVSSGHHAEGLAIAVQLARRGQDTRERFRSSLDVARLAMSAGAHEIARPILEGLVPIAEQHNLETWDPSLCARLYASLYACLPADAEARPTVFEVLCRLDPSAALRARLPTGQAGKTSTASQGSHATQASQNGHASSGGASASGRVGPGAQAAQAGQTGQAAQEAQEAQATERLSRWDDED